jgi:hypothetical protein
MLACTADSCIQDPPTHTHSSVPSGLQELNEAIAQSRAYGKLLVVFSALTWCRPCKGMQRPVAKLAEAYRDTVRGAGAGHAGDDLSCCALDVSRGKRLRDP